MFKHILACTDGSRLSDKAVSAAIGLAAETGARLTVFHATQDYPLIPFPEYAMADAAMSPVEWKAEQEKRARHILDRVAVKAKKADVKCATVFGKAAHPYLAILQAAKKARCDVIVMASHGRRGIAGVVLGSETHKVLIHGKLPVLVYR
jgi:nucleotide-binding universal stress UspA family protein